MSLQIVEYKLKPLPEATVHMPVGTAVFGVGHTNEDGMWWPTLLSFSSSETDQMEQRTFIALPNGSEVPGPGVVYVGTAYGPAHANILWPLHIFERVGA